MRDVSFEVSKGEIFGVFGLTGAGKTTLLKTIEGTVGSNGGSVLFDDRDLTAASRDAKKLNRPDLTRGSIWKRLFRDRSSESTHSRRQRIITEALSSTERVLLLDEPFSGMDTDERVASYSECASAAHDKGLPIVIASNDFEEVLQTCDRVAIMVRGEIKQIGAPQEIYESPDSRVVAAITGRNNLFAARRLTSSKAEIPEFHTIDGGHRLFAQRVDRGALGALNQNVTLGIRPEHISISFGASFPADNLLKAEITAVKFLGPTTLLDLNADGLSLQALVLRLVGLNPGDECMVGLPPERILIFRD